MGRPVKKSRFGNTAGDFEVTGAFSLNTTQPDGTGAETVSTASGNYIVSQRGSRQFLVNFLSTDASTRLEQTLTLTAVAPGSLTAEFCVQLILDDSTVAYVAKFFNRTVHYVTAAGATGSIPYTLGTEATDEQKTAGSGTIDVL
jgi:hypothetical protein